MDRDGTAGKVSRVDISLQSHGFPLPFPGIEKQDDGAEDLAQWGKHSLGGSMGKDLSI